MSLAGYTISSLNTLRSFVFYYAADKQTDRPTNRLTRKSYERLLVNNTTGINKKTVRTCDLIFIEITGRRNFNQLLDLGNDKMTLSYMIFTVTVSYLYT